MDEPIYLDHNATAPILPEVADAIREASLRFVGNSGSQHQAGRLARRALEEARERIGELLGARLGGQKPDRVFFTSGGTEANNLALFGLLGSEAVDATEAGRLVISAIEHPSIAEPARRLETFGWQVDRVGVDRNGVILLDELEDVLRPETCLVSLMLANNETGVLQPIAEAAALCAERGVLLHTDAAQVVGKLPVDFAGWNLAMLSSAAHKFHGPCGIGVLVVRDDVAIRPTTFGGHQQSDIRPGTEPIALAIGMRTALECWHQEAESRRSRIAEMRDQLEKALLGELATAVVIGQGAERLPNTANIAFIGFDRQALVMALDLAGVACSTGSACASGSSEPSPTLVAMGLEKDVIGGSIRLSLGATTTKADIEESIRRILPVLHR
ncbi:MAG: cysteine desulfurase [Planctomycetes bacterium]|nr:cysteine desulfurase [Planctomycetota bacterium]